MARQAPVLQLTEAQRLELQRVVRAGGSSQSQVFRASIVLLAAQGQPNEEIAGTLETSPQSVGKWRRRFAGSGLAGLHDAARSGRPVSLPADKLNTVLTQAAQPPKPRTQWSVRRHGPARRGFQKPGPATLESERPQTAFAPDLQTLQ